MVVVGVPPMGCMPVLRSMRNITKCDVGLNKITFSFNSKIERELNRLGNWTLFVDVNRVILDAIHNPKRYGTYMHDLGIEKISLFIKLNEDY